MRDRFADPQAATATLAQVQRVKDKLEAMNIRTAELTELAALFAVSYVAATRRYEDAHKYYTDQLAQGDDDDVRDLREEALDVLAWQALYGPNGSEGQRSASHTLRWSEEYKNAIPR